MHAWLWAAISEAAVRELLLATAGFAVLILVSVYVIGKIRAASVQQEPAASELMSNFRELHARGVLSDAEFRTIKTTLTDRLQQELKTTAERVRPETTRQAAPVNPPDFNAPNG